MQPQATVGRILHYSLRKQDVAPESGVREGEIRPAMIVKVWPNEYPPGNQATGPDGTKLEGDGYNCQVFLDGTGQTGQSSNDGNALLWVTSVAICEKPTPGHLHWPPKA